MKYIEKLWDFIVWSSADPDRLSLTTRGFLTGVVTIVSIGAGLQNVHLPSELLTSTVDSIIVAVQAIIGAVAAVATVGGLLRKIYLTWKGENLAIKD